MKIHTDPRFEDVLSNYPSEVKPRMEKLRALVHDSARDLGLVQLEETLKWGEPSFVSRQGSTLRMDWKEKSPQRYALYFQCSTRLVNTFRLVFDRTLQFEGNRAVIFELNQDLPEREVKECIKATLRYHEVKQLEFLGIQF